MAVLEAYAERTNCGIDRHGVAPVVQHFRNGGCVSLSDWEIRKLDEKFEESATAPRCPKCECLFIIGNQDGIFHRPKCPNCGREEGKPSVCPECKGDRVIMTAAPGYGHADDLAEYDPCPTCKGTGNL